MSNTIYSKKFNYTYQITELSTGLKYIGVRSSDIEPSLDLGIHYFSSSTNKEFINNQKENPSNYKYEIINEFDNRLDAINNENELHLKYDVCRSNEYINRTISNIEFDMNGKIVCRDENGNTMVVATDDPRYLSGELNHHSKGNVDRNRMSEITKQRWESDYDSMKEKIHNPESNALRGQAQSEWIKNNPDAHKERMDKINKNPEKIAKMAEKHRGMKRSDEAKVNISEAKKASFANKTNEEIGATVGRGMKYVTDTITRKSRRVPKDYVLLPHETNGTKKPK